MQTDVKIIEPTGILDSTQADAFRMQVEEALEQKANIILIDLKNITFVDSSGLGILVVVLKKVRAVQKKMYVCSINDQVRMLFELTSMDRVFEAFPDRAAFEEKVIGVPTA